MVMFRVMTWLTSSVMSLRMFFLKPVYSKFGAVVAQAELPEIVIAAFIGGPWLTPVASFVQGHLDVR